MESQIRELLASGMSAIQAAETCGVSLEKVQALLKNQAFFQSIQDRGKELRASRVEQRYVDVEEKILKNIQKRAEDEMTELPQLCRALEVVAKNRVAYRSPASSLTGPQQINVVTLILPKAAEDTKVIMNSQNEIVAVGDRNMASMPLQGVQEMFKQLEKKEKGNVYEHEHAAKSPTAAAA